MNVAGLLAAWIEHRTELSRLGRLAPSTLENQRQIAGRLSASLGGNEVQGLRKSHVDLYVAARLQSCAPVTVSGEIDVLRQALNWAVDEQFLPQRPRLPTVAVPNVEAPLPSDDDYAWFLRTMAPRHSDALLFMLLTGLSPHELERLQAGDEDQKTSEVLIGHRDDFRVKQASRRRRVPMNQAALAIWLKWTIGLATDAHPFPGVDALQKAMRRHVLARGDAPAAADGLTPKMMRKWFASKIASEQSEAVLQRLMGHSPGSPITRRHYVRTNDAQLRDAVNEVVLA